MNNFLNKIICGNCIEIMQKIPDESIDLIVADPPYNLGKDFGNKSDMQKDIRPFHHSWLKECQRILRNKGSIYCFYSQQYIPIIQPILEEYFDFKNLIVWHYKNGVKKKARDRFLNTWEALFYCAKGNPEFNITYDFDRYGENSFDVWTFAIPQSNFVKDKKYHPTQKPLKLIEKILKASSNENDIVLDPFIRSGTTAVACVKLDRNFIGIELNLEYCKIAESRIKNEDNQLIIGGGCYE